MEQLEQWLLRALGSILGLAVLGCGGIATPAYGAPVPAYGAPTATYEVSGTVENATTGQPIPGIQVTYLGGLKVLTGSEGKFTLTGTAGYCTTCSIVADDVDGTLNGSFEEATVPLNLTQTGAGNGTWFQGTFNEQGVVIKMTAKP